VFGGREAAHETKPRIHTLVLTAHLVETLDGALELVARDVAVPLEAAHEALLRQASQHQAERQPYCLVHPTNSASSSPQNSLVSFTLFTEVRMEILDAPASSQTTVMPCPYQKVLANRRLPLRLDGAGLCVETRIMFMPMVFVCLMLFALLKCAV
jgi:hypothetical protein